jgi:hypothetical protein
MNGFDNFAPRGRGADTHDWGAADAGVYGRVR